MVLININFRYIGENVRNARQTKNLTIEQLAELAGISDSFLGVAERGTSGFSVETIIKLSSVLGVTTDSLLLKQKPDKVSASKLDTLLTLVSGCTDEDIDYLVEFVKLNKKMGRFKVKKV